MPTTAAETYQSESLSRYVPEHVGSVLVCASDDGRLARTLEQRGEGTVTLIDAKGDPLAQAQDANGPFSCIVCDDTIGRLRTPDPLLRCFWELLDDGGLLVLTAPNLQHHANVQMLAEGRWEFAENGALARKNIRFFTAYELVDLVEASSFSSERCHVIASDSPEAFPRDENNCVQRGRITFGPLDDNEYPFWLARDFVVLATKPKDG